MEKFKQVGKGKGYVLYRSKEDMNTQISYYVKEEFFLIRNGHRVLVIELSEIKDMLEMAKSVKVMRRYDRS